MNVSGFRMGCLCQHVYKYTEHHAALLGVDGEAQGREMSKYVWISVAQCAGSI